MQVTVYCRDICPTICGAKCVLLHSDVYSTDANKLCFGRTENFFNSNGKKYLTNLYSASFRFYNFMISVSWSIIQYKGN